MTYLEYLKAPKVVNGYLQYSPGTKGSWYVSCDSETLKSLETGKRYSYKSVTVTGGVK